MRSTEKKKKTSKETTVERKVTLRNMTEGKQKPRKVPEAQTG